MQKNKSAIINKNNSEGNFILADQRKVLKNCTYSANQCYRKCRGFKVIESFYGFCCNLLVKEACL